MSWRRTAFSAGSSQRHRPQSGSPSFYCRYGHDWGGRRKHAQHEVAEDGECVENRAGNGGFNRKDTRKLGTVRRSSRQTRVVKAARAESRIMKMGNASAEYAPMSRRYKPQEPVFSPPAQAAKTVPERRRASFSAVMSEQLSVSVRRKYRDVAESKAMQPSCFRSFRPPSAVHCAGASG